jgi:hypothetical protein
MNLVTPKVGAEHELLFKNWIIYNEIFCHFFSVVASLEFYQNLGISKKEFLDSIRKNSTNNCDQGPML